MLTYTHNAHTHTKYNNAIPKEVWMSFFLFVCFDEDLCRFSGLVSCSSFGCRCCYYHTICTIQCSCSPPPSQSLNHLFHTTCKWLYFSAISSDSNTEINKSTSLWFAKWFLFSQWTMAIHVYRYEYVHRFVMIARCEHQRDDCEFSTNFGKWNWFILMKNETENTQHERNERFDANKSNFIAQISYGLWNTVFGETVCSLSILWIRFHEWYKWNEIKRTSSHGMPSQITKHMMDTMTFLQNRHVTRCDMFAIYVKNILAYSFNNTNSIR